MRPGATQLTVIPRGPTSPASVFSQPVTPGRSAFDSARWGTGSFTAIDVIAMMRPAGLSSRYGRQRWTRRTSGCSSSSTAWSSDSGVTSSALPGGGPPPFQTSTSRPPKAAIVCSTARSRSRGTVTSPRTASPPTRSASRSITSRRRPRSVTFAPSAASDSALARPSPDDAPVTMAVRPLRPRFKRPLRRQDADDLTDGLGARPQRGALVIGEVELDDLLDALRAELHRHAHVQAVDAVLALEVRRARKHALLVQHDRVDHLRRRRARRVPGGRAEQVDELAAALRGALDHRLDAVLGDELAQRDAADGGRAHHRDHLVAVAAEHHRLHVLHRRAGLPRDERGEPGRVENARHAEHALFRPAGDVLRHVAHRVERLRDDDEDRVRALRDHLLGDGTDDLLVRRDEVVARHPRRAREARRDDDDRRACTLLIVVRADDVRLVAENGAHLVDVERLALRQAFLDVDEDDVRVVAGRQDLRARRAHIAGADDGDLPAHAHTGIPASSFSMIASATSLVPTAVASLRVGFMSYVTLAPSAITSEIARSSFIAALCSPRCRSMSIPDRSSAIGFTLFWPAYFGAEPCVGSKTATSSP